MNTATKNVTQLIVILSTNSKIEYILQKKKKKEKKKEKLNV